MSCVLQVAWKYVIKKTKKNRRIFLVWFKGKTFNVAIVTNPNFTWHLIHD